MEIVKCNDFNIDLVNVGKLEENKSAKMPFTFMGITYGKNCGPFYLQLPQVNTFGILEKSFEKTSYTIPMDFPESDPIRQQIADIFNKIYVKCNAVLNKEVDDSHLPPIINFPMTKMKRLDKTKPKCIFLKLKHYDDDGQGNANGNTQFLKPLPRSKYSKKNNKVAEVIPWKDLLKGRITHYPLLHFQKIFIGSKPSIVIRLHSSVVVDRESPSNIYNGQNSIIESLFDDNPEIGEMLSAKLKASDDLDPFGMEDHDDPIGGNADEASSMMQTMSMKSEEPVDDDDGERKNPEPVKASSFEDTLKKKVIKKK